MNIAILGGTGRTGRLIIKELLAKGHKVKCLARDPDKIAPAFGLEFVKGQAWEGGKIMLTLTGCDAVVMALGSVKGSPGDVCSVATSLVLSAMGKLGIKRIVAITSLGVGASWTQIPPLAKVFFKLFFMNQIKDKAKQEELLNASSTLWTVLRPGGLVDVPVPGALKTGTDNRTPAARVTRQMVAEVTARVVTENEWIHKAVYLTT